MSLDTSKSAPTSPEIRRIKPNYNIERFSNLMTIDEESKFSENLRNVTKQDYWARQSLKNRHPFCMILDEIENEIHQIISMPNQQWNTLTVEQNVNIFLYNNNVDTIF